MLAPFILFISFLIYFLLNVFLMALYTPLPISDTGTVRYRTMPWGTFSLIVINALVFLLWQAPEYYQAETLRDLMPYVSKVWTYGFREAHLVNPDSIGAFTTFTSMFMHGDMWHLFGNMLYLWTFGRRVEDACGTARFLVFYLIAGMVANMFSAILNPGTADLPGIGASGAISGVMGAYLILFPGAQITCLWMPAGTWLRMPWVGLLKMLRVPGFKNAKTWKGEAVMSLNPIKNTAIFLQNSLIALPAWTQLLFFLLLQIVPSIEDIQGGKDVGGVSTLAHLTGFLTALGIFLYVRKDLLTRYFAGRAL
ncbi:MAG: rhomboid family intramembrane serine protease [Anaerolineaceae bacterium]|nr:rhomboid family intramembrane serine protease [Anaerolineaceae bacterium]